MKDDKVGIFPYKGFNIHINNTDMSVYAILKDGKSINTYCTTDSILITITEYEKEFGEVNSGATFFFKDREHAEQCVIACIDKHPEFFI